MRPNGKAPCRQGDILLIPTDDVPGTRTQIAPEGTRLIIAAGEATGHHHALLLECETDAEYCTVAGEVDRWLKMQRHGLSMMHEEHGTIGLEEPHYMVRRQLEYSPAELRQVAD